MFFLFFFDFLFFFSSSPGGEFFTLSHTFALRFTTTRKEL